jgi:hypothetical protein
MPPKGSRVRALYRPADGRPDPSLLNLYPAFYALVWFRSMAIFRARARGPFLARKAPLISRIFQSKRERESVSAVALREVGGIASRRKPGAGPSTGLTSTSVCPRLNGAVKKLTLLQTLEKYFPECYTRLSEWAHCFNCDGGICSQRARVKFRS